MSNLDMSLLARLRHAMAQTAIVPRRIARVTEGDAWCVSFGTISSFYASVDICDDHTAWGAHKGPDLASVSYRLDTTVIHLRRWLIFAHAWCGDGHTTGQKLLMASRMSHNKACVPIH